jgi:hypothetical protein
MMLERNNREVLDVILRWLARRDVANEEPNVRVPMTR